MNRFFLTIAILLLAGCANKPIIWDKQGGTAEQFRRDQMSCRQYGMQSAQAHGLAGNLFVESWIQDETIKCLENLGYQQRPQQTASQN